MFKPVRIDPRQVGQTPSTNSGSSPGVSQQEAAEAARRLFSYFPPREVGDPMVVLAGTVELLMQYPRSVLASILSPISGLPATMKWAPSVAEIRDACESRMSSIRARQRQQDVQRSQLQERRQIEDRSSRKSYDEIADDLARHGINIRAGKASSPALSGRDDFKERFGLSDDDFDALPDQPMKKVG